VLLHERKLLNQSQQRVERLLAEALEEINADYFTSSVMKKHLYNVKDQHRASHMSVR